MKLLKRFFTFTATVVTLMLLSAVKLPVTLARSSGTFAAVSEQLFLFLYKILKPDSKFCTPCRPNNGSRTHERLLVCVHGIAIKIEIRAATGPN